MEARDSHGLWSGPDAGWTEGDKWCYSFGVMHDIPTLIDLRGGPSGFIRSLDEHFEGGESFGLYLPLSLQYLHKGHNDHTNEVGDMPLVLWLWLTHV